MRTQYNLGQNESMTLLHGREADNIIVHYEEIKRKGPVIVTIDTRSQATRQVIDYMVDIPRVILADWVEKKIIGDPHSREIKRNNLDSY